MEPKFVLSKSKVCEQYNKLNNLGVTISYSWKTNSEVGKILEKETNSFFSIHSLEEINEINDKSKIWFFAQAWNNNDIQDLINKGIRNFVVDNETDLKIIVDFISIEKIKINLLLRMKFQEQRVQTGKYFVYGLNTKTINNWILKLKNHKMIDKIGIHVHRKSQNVSEWDLKYELEDSLSKEVLEIIDLINIGGGFPIEYRNYTSEVLDYIFPKIKELKNWLKEKNIELMVEPGRFIAGPSVELQTQILSIHDNKIIVNSSVYQGNTDAIFQDSLKLMVKGESENGEEYLIKGKTPCSLDIFRYNVKIPNVKIGDKIIFLNAGAYNFSTNFCKLKEIKTEVVE
jgi:ornithine decarboxylase|tara:strand:- start:8759 stop:9787 length:1029 start_codon:yes stop_codon:yes gene_type:complete